MRLWRSPLSTLRLTYVTGVGGRAATWAQRDFVAWGSALGGTVAWAGVVVSAALNYRRATVPILWWVLCVIVLVCFLSLGGSQARTSARDRAIFAVLTLAAIGANAVWGADLMSGVLLVLVAGVAGWVVLLIVVLLLGGVQLVVLGVLGEPVAGGRGLGAGQLTGRDLLVHGGALFHDQAERPERR